MSLEYIPRSGIAGSYGNLMFNIRGTVNCSPQQLHNFAFPPAAHEGSTVSTSSPTLIIDFDYSHPSDCEVISLISLMANDIAHLFMCLFAICVSFLVEISIHTLCPFLNLVCLYY